MTKHQATNYAHQFRFELGRDFHTLGAEVVGRIIDAADAHKYRKPKNANGSRARYFYAVLCRAARGTA